MASFEPTKEKLLYVVKLAELTSEVSSELSFDSYVEPGTYFIGVQPP